MNKNGVYTLTEVGKKIDADKGVKLAQANSTPSKTDGTISKKYITLDGNTSDTSFSKVYGNKDTVYMTAKLGALTNNKVTYGIIKDVDSIVTGVENADLNVWSKTNAQSKYGVSVTQYASGVYSLYNDKGVVIAAVVVGEDNGSSKNLIYVHSSSLEKEEYNGDSTGRAAGDGEWTWSRKVIKDGVEVELTEVGDSSSYLEKMNQYHWYQVKLNANGEVIGAYKLATGDKADLDVASLELDKDFVTKAENIEKAINSGKSTVLFYGPDITSQLKFNGRTLFVDNSDKKGFIVREDVKVILQQYEKNSKETYITEYSGDGDLKAVIDEINERYNGKNYKYQVSAILEDGIASSVMIWDANTDWHVNTGGSNAGDNAEGEHTGSKTDIVDVNELLKEGNVVIDGSAWTPKDAKTKTLNIPRDTTLTVMGDFDASQVTINAAKGGKLVVGGTLTLDTSKAAANAPITLDCDVHASNVRIVANDSPQRDVTIEETMKVDNKLTIDGKGNVYLKGDVTVDGEMDGNGTGELHVTGTLTVNGEVKAPKTIKVTSINSLHVYGNVKETVTIITGDKKNVGNNGYVEITGTMAGTFQDDNVADVENDKVQQDVATVKGEVKLSKDSVIASTEFKPSKLSAAVGATIILEEGTDNSNLAVTDSNGSTVNTTDETTIVVGQKVDEATPDKNKPIDVTTTGESTTSEAPFSADARVIYNEETWTAAVNAGFILLPNDEKTGSKSWTEFVKDAHGVNTLPWLAVKVTAETTPFDTTVTPIVKLDGKVVAQYIGEKKEADTWVITAKDTEAGDCATFHWEMAQSKDQSTTQSLGQEFAKSGTYEVFFNWKVNGNDVTDQEPVSDEIEWDNSEVMIALPDAGEFTVKSGETALDPNGQDFTWSGDTITVNRAYNLEDEAIAGSTFGEYIMKGEAGKAWFEKNDKTTPAYGDIKYAIIVHITRFNDKYGQAAFKYSGEPNVEKPITLEEGDDGFTVVFGWDGESDDRYIKVMWSADEAKAKEVSKADFTKAFQFDVDWSNIG